MTERDKIVSQRIFFSDMEEGNHKDEYETIMSHMKEPVVVEDKE